MKNKSNDVADPPNGQIRYELTAAQIAFAEVLGEALARQWMSDQKLADGAAKAGGAGRLDHRADEI